LPGELHWQLKDGDGHAIARIGLPGLHFGLTDLATRTTLYFTSQFQNAQDGLFGAITTRTGQSQLEYRLQKPPTDTSATMHCPPVAAALDNPGTPSGTVTFLDGSNPARDRPVGQWFS